jgi:hypothetical protein
MDPTQSWVMAWPEVQGSWWCVDLLWGRGLSGLRGGDPGRAWICHRAGPWHGLRSGIPVLHGSDMGLEPGTAGGAEIQVERSSSSEALWGRDLAGWLFFY